MSDRDIVERLEAVIAHGKPPRDEYCIRLLRWSKEEIERLRLVISDAIDDWGVVDSLEEILERLKSEIALKKGEQ